MMEACRLFLLLAFVLTASAVSLERQKRQVGLEGPRNEVGEELPPPISVDPPVDPPVEEKEDTDTEEEVRPVEELEEVVPGGLSEGEITSLVSAHNKLRDAKSLQELTWSKPIEVNAKMLVDCDVEWPGPPPTYTNFGTFKSDVADLVAGWGKEDIDLTKSALETGCRPSAYGGFNCNHNTNLMQPHIRRIACAAKECDGGDRQLVCVYVDYEDMYWYGRRRR
ncbi:uncharacterized protein LOC106177609 [Lingula anatina]|uniref:Uncharacterized protein LOC106158792 n=1 Tax=Lingula anatina TaxID=7574 RepID=A0A1S3K0T6_LINAN|nr:uncharacterized protein LOC106158792 [Lingula anatina]XP_013415896.1 uncharacterized protein LOC106177609 [Lingula anatina]|eukprot:XP_013390345.1 uncharacterized protein LOC106158792 [Lingula anatina]